MENSALVARARGLAGHLLRPEQVAQLCAAPRTQLAMQLAALDAVEADTSTTLDARALDLALRQHAAQRLRVLARWTGNGSGALSLLFDEEDMHSLRALVRTTLAGVAPDLRLAGVLATPTLPLRALGQLAACGDLANFASLLITWSNPFGAALAVEAARPQPDLFRIDLALARVFAMRARHQAGRDRMMRHFAERIIDAANVWSCLVLSDHHADIDGVELWLPGGRLIRADDIEFAVRAAHRELLTQRLLPRLSGTPLAVALTADAGRGAEDAMFDALTEEFVSLARRNPTSLAPVVAFVLRQRAELRALLRIVWSIFAGMPSSMIRRHIGAAA